MSLKKPIAEICTGLFCFCRLNFSPMHESNSNYYDDESFNEENFQKLLPLRPTEFIDCRFTSIDFTQTHFSLSKFIECKFENCNFSNISLKNTVFRDPVFSKCKLIGLNFSETQALSSPSFVESVLDYSVFQSLGLLGSIFNYCSIKEADFYEANLSKADFSGSNLEGAVFNKANLAMADFRGASNYYIDLRNTNIKKAKFNLPEALSLLQAMDIILE